jgi:hypothetical protein
VVLEPTGIAGIVQRTFVGGVDIHALFGPGHIDLEGHPLSFEVALEIGLRLGHEG